MTEGKDLEQVFEGEIEPVYTEYDSNNSGGSFWLTDEDWVNLEKAGWQVSWGGHGHPSKYKSYEDAIANNGRWLGAIACGARRDLPIRQAIEEWEKITGQDASAEGCGCCGPPHSFDEYSAITDKPLRSARIVTHPSLEIE